uniref:AP-3 complex subunit beta n=1 Tax=Sinocyclocheilus anshuiensis TaxID=1608454 RepID=A0A671KDM4_9TELE
MSASSAFSDEKGGSASEPEYGHDPASGGIFSSDYKRHDDLKEMLDSNKDSLKLEAMKRIVAMIARGKNTSDLFPAVVKNVACKNIEVKKLVYVYLVRYAEEQQDLALLSISTFQRGLKDPNQLIRASALRVLSSIRVTIIVPIMMLAIKEAASDMSPYVRKTAAHAIPKLHSLDPEQKDQLIEVIEKLLADKTTLVAGSVVMAFEEVCPDRIDLIHKNYRKLCNLLIDVEEWGQVVIINMLTRYARTQFLNPNINESLLEDSSEKAFYASDDEEDEDKKAEAAALAKRKPYVMDPDHRLLLRNTKPLLQSRNAAVVMAVAQLYFHLAPKAEVGIIAKALVRLMRSHSEVQYVVLQNVATMTIKRRGMFEPYLKSFYIRSTDPTQIKILKLEVLTNLANETNISTILREFQVLFYMCCSYRGGTAENRELAVEGRGFFPHILIYLDCQKNTLSEHILGKPNMSHCLIKRDNLCLHIILFRCTQVRCLSGMKLLRITFLCVFLFFSVFQTKLLTQYVLNLAKYDQNYDIRDRARFIRQLIVPTDKSGALSKYAKKLFLALKPAPVLESQFKDRDHFQLGSLSHLLNAKAGGYQELPDWPESAPDPSVRNVEVKDSIPDWSKCTSRKDRKEKKLDKPFYSDSEGESGPTESADSESDSGSGSESASASDESGSGSESEESGEETESEEEEEDEEKENKRKKRLDKTKAKKPAEESAERCAIHTSYQINTFSHFAQTPVSKQPPKQSKKESKKETQEMSLLDLDDFEPTPTSAPVTPVNFLSSSLVSDLEGLSLTDTILAPTTIAPSGSIKMYELLHRITGEGLAVEYCFSRQPFSPDPNMVAVQIQFTNNTNSETKNLHIEEPRLQSGMRIREFAEIEVLAAGESVTVVMGIDFCDSTQAANFQLCTHTRKFFVSIQPPVGELMTPAFLTENDFKKEQGKLMGMNEISEKLTLGEKCVNEHVIVERVTATANLSRVPCGSDKECRFAGKTVSSGCLVLVTIATKEGGRAQLTVNCEKMVIGTMLVKDIMQALSQ